LTLKRHPSDQSISAKEIEMRITLSLILTAAMLLASGILFVGSDSKPATEQTENRPKVKRPTINGTLQDALAAAKAGAQ
jgi:hypothetical protein